MKKLMIISVLSLLFIVSFTGCNEKDTNSVKNIDIPSVTLETTEILSSETTEISTVTENSETTLNSETSLSESISENTSVSETVLSENSVQTAEIPVTTIESAENSVMISDIQNTEISTDNPVFNNIQVVYNSSELSEECVSQITQYLSAMHNCDTETYEKMLVPIYKDHLNEYLSQENYTLKTLLEKNKENLCQITNGDFTYSKLELEILSEDDFQNNNIPDYATSYKEQLDELSFEKDGSYISETFTECYSVLFNAYALSNETEYCIFNNNVMVIFKTENQYYIMMS